MKLKKLSIVALGCLGFAMGAEANEVLLTANKPITITYRIAHKNLNTAPVFGELQSVEVNKNVHIPVSLDHFDRAGIVIISGNGHQLPASDNQFDQPKQCSMTTDKTKATGALEFTLSSHSISCSTYGGIYS
jgi:hypothetical protein